MTTDCTISISRPSNGRDDPYISIRLQDEISRATFFEGKIGLKEFAEALTGLSCCPIEGTFRGLEYVGMKKITEGREIVCPLHTYDRKELSEWLKANAQEDGWILSSYLGSQQDVKYLDDGTAKLHYSVSRYEKQA